MQIVISVSLVKKKNIQLKKAKLNIYSISDAAPHTYRWTLLFRYKYIRTLPMHCEPKPDESYSQQPSLPY